MARKTIGQMDVKGKRVLMRVDFNVPQEDDGTITDDRRIRMAVPSVRSVIDRGGKLVLMSHLGRPKGKGIEPAFSMKPAADRLAELLPKVNVHFAGDSCVGEQSRHAVEVMREGEIVVLENLRFEPGEKDGDAAFAAKLAQLGDIYCNDAFGTAHRNDASMLAVPQAMNGKPRVAGLLLEKELQYLSDAIEDAKRPFIAVLGGAKVSDKLGAIRNLLSRVDQVLVGGAMAYTFLKAQSIAVGGSKVEDDMLEEARSILDEAQRAGASRIALPIDHVCARDVERNAETRVAAGAIPDDWLGLDIGPATCEQFSRQIRSGRTIVWNGPMGVFETPPFDAGTRAVAMAMAEATRGGAVTIIGGGDSAAAVEAFGMEDAFSHISTGGGASLQMLEGQPFDSVQALDQTPTRVPSRA